MHAHDDRDQFTPPPAPGRGRAVTLAVLAHLLLLGALTWGVAWKSGSDQPAVVAELWSAVPQQAAPRAVEPPSPPQPPMPPTPPKPPPPEPPVVVPTPPKVTPPPPAPPQRAEPDTREADIAVEREKQRLAKEKRELEAKEKLEREKQRKELQRVEQEKKDKLQKEKAEREKAEREKADKEQKKLAEEKRKKDEAIEKASAKAADERRQENIRRMQGLAGATGAPTATGTAERDSGPSGGYGGRVAAKVKPNIVYPDTVSGNPRAEVEVRTSPDGTIVGTRLTKSSGNKAWDDAVLRALEKTATLPRDTDGRVPPALVIGFRPQD
ncbi:MAG: cell envelope integrity protein TolA [Simplicispira sp.]|nr:cell envelope integrity protein TolA [Simplicispira sp.]